jgi:hypothetical protein
MPIFNSTINTYHILWHLVGALPLILICVKDRISATHIQYVHSIHLLINPLLPFQSIKFIPFYGATRHVRVLTSRGMAWMIPPSLILPLPTHDIVSADPKQISFSRLHARGHVVAQWLRHCATNRKVARSIPDGVIGIFHWHNPSGHTMALASTQTPMEMSSRNIFWG